MTDLDQKVRELAQAEARIEALQADNDRLQAEVTRLLTAFDGLDLTTKGKADD